MTPWITLILLALWCLLPSGVGAIQTAPLVDTCNRTENPLASGWIGPLDPDQAGVMTANGTVCIGAASNASTYWGTLVGADQVLTMTVPDAIAAASAHHVQLYVRVQQPHPVSQTVDGYRCQFSPFDSTVDLRRITDGAASASLGLATGITISNDDELGCQILGSTLSAWLNHAGAGWQWVVSVEDTTHTGTGFVGFSLGGTSVHVDSIGFSAVESTRLGLHHTAEELALWKQRSLTDAEYTAIVNNANSWVSTPDARWTGQVAATCFVDFSEPSRQLDDGLTDAAFVYLLTGTTSYRTPVLSALLAQAAVVGTNFADTTRWCLTHDGSAGVGDYIGPWLRRLLYGYSYIRPTVTPGERVTLDTWFTNAATWITIATHNNIAKRFPNRLLDDYSGCTTGTFCPGGDTGLTHFGGPMTKNFHNAWGNLASSSMALVGAVGAVLNNPTHLDSAKRYVKEWLQFGVFPGGIPFDQYRWNNTPSPQHAYGYAHLSTGAVVSIVEHLARIGDLELYSYSTTNGLHGTAGTPAKTLLSVLQHLAGLTNGTIFHYASATSTADPDLRIDQNGPGQVRINYVYLAPANIFYRNAFLKTAYTTAVGAYGSIGCDELRGEWCTYPRVRFMFGSAEGLVWPYTLTVPVVSAVCCLQFLP